MATVIPALALPGMVSAGECGRTVASPATSLTTSDGLNRVNFADRSPVDVELSPGTGIDAGSQAGFDFRAVPTAAWNSTAMLDKVILVNDNVGLSIERDAPRALTLRIGYSF